MKRQKIKIYCHEKDCLEFYIIEWNEEFIKRFYCKKHSYKFVEGKHEIKYDVYNHYKKKAKCLNKDYGHIFNRKNVCINCGVKYAKNYSKYKKY